MRHIEGFSKYQVMVKLEPDTVYIPPSRQTRIPEINKSACFAFTIPFYENTCLHAFSSKAT